MVEEVLLTFLGVYTLIFGVDYFAIKRRKLKMIVNKDKKGKIKSISELEYLKSKFKIKDKYLYNNKVIVIVSIINSFIIAGVSSVVIFIDMDIMWRMLIAFGLLFGLIYALYEILGRYLKRRDD